MAVKGKTWDRLRKCFENETHKGPIFRVVLLAVQTSRGKGHRVTLRKTVGHYCSDCLLGREFTVKGCDLMPGPVREA